MHGTLRLKIGDGFVAVDVATFEEGDLVGKLGWQLRLQVNRLQARRDQIAELRSAFVNRGPLAVGFALVTAARRTRQCDLQYRLRSGAPGDRIAGSCEQP